MQNNAKPIPPWHRPNGHEPHSSTNPWSSYRPSIASSSFQQMDLFYEQTAGPLPRDLLYPWFWRNSMTKLLINIWKSSNWTHPECWSSPQPLLCYIMGPMPRQQFFQHLHPLTTALMTHSSLHTSSQQATPIRNLKLNILQLHHSAVTIHHHHLGCVGCPSKCKSHSFQFLAVFVHVVRA